MNNFEYFLGSKLIFNNDLKEGLKEAKESVKAEKAFLITDPGLAMLPNYEAVRRAMKEIGFVYDEYTDVRPLPKDYTIDDCARVFEESGADCIIAFGGGSALDTAKGAAILRTNGGQMRDYFGVNMVKKTPCPVIGIPTTAGSGAEVSRVISVTDSQKNVKDQIMDRACCPAVALYVPAVLKGSPKSVTTTAGIDALGHAVESYLNVNGSPVTQAVSLKGAGMIFKNILAFVNDTANEEAAANMQIGSTLGIMGAGFTGNIDGHCVARSVGGSGDINHGAAVAVALPYCMEFNINAATDKLANLAKEFGLAKDGMSQTELAQQAVLGVQKLRDDLGLCGNYKDLGMKLDNLDAMVERSVYFSQNGSDAYTSPGNPTFDDFKKMYMDGYNGRVICF